MFYNELTFLIHLIVTLAFLLIAIRMGKITLMVFTTMHWVLASIFVVKQIALFGFTCTLADVYAVGMISLSLVQYLYGKKAAKQTINIAFLLILFTLTMSFFHLYYRPASVDTMHSALKKIFTPTPRIMIASIAVSISASYFNLYSFKLFGKFRLPVRTFFAVSLTQVFDTILFVVLGLWGVVDHVVHMIFISYTIKLVITLLNSSFLTFFEKLKKKEKTDEVSV